MITTLPIARSVFGADAGGATRVDLEIADGIDSSAVIHALETRLQSEPFVVSTPREIAASLAATTGDFAAMTALIAAVALFAGAFLIFNTLSMTVVERVRELGLLRAAGATRRQLTGYILLQPRSSASAGRRSGSCSVVCSRQAFPAGSAPSARCPSARRSRASRMRSRRSRSVSA